MRHHRTRRAIAAGSAAALMLGLLAACGGNTGPPVLYWYVNPDSGGQEVIAQRCTEASDGRYRIETKKLPRESSQQRLQLIRRLAAEDSSIDLMSLDTPYTPEFAEAGYLADVPDDVAAQAGSGVVAAALKSATWEGELVAIPFWANTQLLWYRESVVKDIGLDMSEPVTWQQLIEVAKEHNLDLAVQGRRAESLTVWINALIEGAGGSIITKHPEKPENIEFGLNSRAAKVSARAMSTIADVGLGGPALSTSGEGENVEMFEQGGAAFMVNWPFVWRHAQAAIEDGTLEKSVLEDYGWALYPRTVAGEPAAPPHGGINIGIGAFSDHPELAFDAALCATSVKNQTYYFISNGNPAAKAAVYDDPRVLEAFPMAPLIKKSLEMAAPRPKTPYYSEVSASLQRTYHTLSRITPGRTGPKAAELIHSVLSGEDLL